MMYQIATCDEAFKFFSNNFIFACEWGQKFVRRYKMEMYIMNTKTGEVLATIDYNGSFDYIASTMLIP